ncbi:hypothetical protein ACIQNV_39340 [Streptomyces hydrogenans]|uniref:hypothetical protein n=1 Tax=Streptomyces hydrogenans TaxID=1873719 RepID=UPI0034480CB0
MGRTRARLAVGSGTGIAADCHQATEAVEVLAVLAPCPADAVRGEAAQAYLIADGTFLPVDRIAADQPYYPGRREKHDMNVQALAASLRPTAVRALGLPLPSTTSALPAKTASSTPGRDQYPLPDRRGTPRHPRRRPHPTPGGRQKRAPWASGQ